MSRRLPLALGALTFAALFATQSGVGFVRDEGYYFEAARSYEQWVLLLLRAPAAALRDTGRYWSANFEHPGLAKLLFALSHLVFTTWLRWLPDALAFRLPAFAFGALLTYWLAVLGAQRSRAAAVFAPALFWGAERTFFHGHLACLDIPICALTAFNRGVTKRPAPADVARLRERTNRLYGTTAPTARPEPRGRVVDKTMDDRTRIRRVVQGAPGQVRVRWPSGGAPVVDVGGSASPLT